VAGDKCPGKPAHHVRVSLSKRVQARKFALSRRAARVSNSLRANSLTSRSRSRSRPLRGRVPTHGQTIARAPGKSRIVMILENVRRLKNS
jgi:hypothetical protein